MLVSISILQALARDGVVPGLSWLGAGVGADDEPLAATLASFATAQVGR